MLLSFLLLVQAVPVADQPAPPAPAKKICKRSAETGSILPARICHTAAEWKQIDAANQDGALDLLRRRGTGMCNGSCR